MEPRRSNEATATAVIPFPPLRREAARPSGPSAPLRLDEPRALRIERWRWTGVDDAFVLTARLPETGERIRFAAPLTPAVRDAIERRATCVFALRAEALEWDVEPWAPEDPRAAVRDPAALEAWAGDALAGDPIARRLVARAAERLAHLAAAGGPPRASVHLASVGETFAGPFADAAYWLRGSVTARDGMHRLGRLGESWRGTLDVGRWVVPVDVTVRVPGGATRMAPEVESRLSARVVLRGTPSDAASRPTG